MPDDNPTDEGTRPENPKGQQKKEGRQQKQEPQQQGKQQKQDQQPQKKEQKETDPFWIRRVFPDALRAIQFSSPTVSTLFADAMFVLDTNTLLAPYQVGKQSVEEIERIYRELSSHYRLFVPEQAAREFAKNRGKKLTEVYDKVHSIASKLPSVEILDCPMLEGLEEYKELFAITDSVKELRKKLGTILNSLKEKLTEWGWNDRVSTLYREIFTANTLVSYDTPDEKLLEELRWRYAHEVPPGYKDGGKPDEGIGDFAIWKSILKLGKDLNKHTVFVCDEQKHDWVYRSNKVPLVPRMELCDEFNGHTGRHFGLVSWTRFLELAGAKAETVSEARRAELWASADDHRLMPITKRVRQLLDDIREIVVEGPKDEGSGYELLRGGDLDGSVEAFVEAKKLYETIVHPPTGIDILNQLEVVVKEINSLNRGLAYVEARMKHSGDEDSAKLREKCDEFLDLYSLYGRATIPLL